MSAGLSWRQVRKRWARLPSLRLSAPAAPALPIRDLWPGDPVRGARLLRGELAHQGAVRPLRPGAWDAPATPAALRAHAHGFAWLRHLRVIGTDAARMRARALVDDWIDNSRDPTAERPDIAGARIAAWLAHFDFFAASADDEFRRAMLARLVWDARQLSAALPAEEQDGRALTALKGLFAAAVALPDHAPYLARALKFLPAELARQFHADGGHIERSPHAQLQALADLTEIRAILAAGGATPPPALVTAQESAASALRLLRHGDGGLALFNGTRDEPATLIDLVLAQCARPMRTPVSLPETGFERLQAGRSLMLVDAAAPPPPGQDRYAHAGTLAFELSIGRERLIVNCGAAPAGNPAWHDAARATAAHSTLTIADTSSSELRPSGLGRRPERVENLRQEANGAHWLELSHDGWRRPFNAVHRRRLYLAESGEDIRGEDAIESPDGHPWAVRFHLHPSVIASMQQGGEAVLLRLPGGGWRLRAEGVKLALEESIYLAGAEPRRSEQVVLSAPADGPQSIKWAITKVA